MVSSMSHYKHPRSYFEVECVCGRVTETNETEWTCEKCKRPQRIEWRGDVRRDNVIELKERAA